MKAFQDTDRVKNGIKEAITLLCKSGLNFQSEVSIDGLLGITLDQNEVFLVSIQEVIRNSTDYCVGGSTRCEPEDCDGTFSQNRSVSSVSKRSKRKRLLTSTYKPIVDMSPSRSSSVDTDDSMNLYYNNGESQHKKSHCNYVSYHTQADEEELNDEPLSLVVRKSPCDSKNELTERRRGSVMQSDRNVSATDLRVQQTQSELLDAMTQNDSHNQQNSIRQTVTTANYGNSHAGYGDQSDIKPVLKPKTNSRKSRTKPKRIVPIERNKADDDDEQSTSSPSGSHSPPRATSQRSTPDDAEGGSETQLYKPSVKIENSDSAEAFSINSDQVSETNCTSFTNVYESGIPITSKTQSGCKKDGLDIKEKVFDGIVQSTPENPWGTIFDPDSHAKWLQSIAAYVQGPVNSPAMVPPLAHQCLPFVGGALPSAKISLQQTTKLQVTSSSRVKDNTSISSKPSSSFVNTPIKVPVAVPKLVHSRSMHMCSNCGTQKTTTWRRGDDGTPLCNACGLYLKLHKPISSGSGQNSLRKVRHQLCSNCNTSVTTMWRRDSDGKPVCNACGLYFKLHKVNRPLTMVKSEIHSRRRKHKYGQFGGKLEPSSPGSVNPANMSLPYPVSSSQQSPPGLLSQTLPLGYPESPGFRTSRDYGETNQGTGSAPSSPELYQECRTSAAPDKQGPVKGFQEDSVRCEQSAEFCGQESADEDMSESPITETSLTKDQETSDRSNIATSAPSSDKLIGVD